MDSSPLYKERAINWLEMPEHIMSTILLEVGAIDILCNVRNVCSSWLKICKDPFFWRVVDFRNSCNRFGRDYDLARMCLQAVDYSCGQLRDISIEDFGTDYLLRYISESSPQLRRLRIISSWNISQYEFIKAVPKFPLLEHLEISGSSSFSAEALKTVGLCCPLLKSLKINFERDFSFESDDEAYAIAENMPNLQNLDLCHNPLTHRGLEAILHGCPCLESLDLRMCHKLYLEEQLERYCVERIKNLRFPCDPFDDSESWDASFDYFCEICSFYPIVISEYDDYYIDDY